MNPLNTIKGTLAAGLAIAIATVFLVHGFGDVPTVLASLYRWLHLLAGITWIGLL